ncbi:MAG: ATP--guanido phosphotransferase [Firmicutes bacterium]|nr:ATP--guanido phosphotransferase [Bacillota bacterium]
MRLARNFRGKGFFTNLKDKEAEDNIRDVYYSINESKTFALYKLDELKDLDKSLMVEKHLISKALLDSKCAAAIINDDETISVMVNEEDHLRLQCITPGLSLGMAYRKINIIDDKILEDFEIAYDAAYGFLTTCITNVGTGMRASVMMFLPSLTRLDRMGEISEIAKKSGLTIRGEKGEGSKPEGSIYQFSNDTTLGVSETEIIRTIEKACVDVAALEFKAGEELLRLKRERTEDEIIRAYYVLKNARMLESAEFVSKMESLKLGYLLGLIEIEKKPSVVDETENENGLVFFDNILNTLKESNIKILAKGNAKTPEQEKIFRASVVRERLLLTQLKF